MDVGCLGLYRSTAVGQTHHGLRGRIQPQACLALELGGKSPNISAGRLRTSPPPPRRRRWIYFNQGRNVLGSRVLVHSIYNELSPPSKKPPAPTRRATRWTRPPRMGAIVDGASTARAGLYPARPVIGALPDGRQRRDD